MDVRITKPNGTTFTLSQYGVKPTDFIVESIQIDPIYEKVEGRSGTIDYGATFGGRRIIRVPFFIEAEDTRDFSIKRDKVFELLLDLNPFYIEEMREILGRDQLVSGKRYLVRLANTFSLNQVWKVGLGEIEFETTDLPFAESARTTDWLDRNNIPSDWHGMGVTPGQSVSYRFPVIGEGGSGWFFLAPGFMAQSGGTGHFSIMNYGNVPINPFEHYLKITIDNIVGSTEFLEILNLTNGTRFRINEGVSKRVVIDGPMVTIGGLQAFRKTSRTFIELDVGRNEFKIRGADSAFISFDFRFYYK